MFGFGEAAVGDMLVHCAHVDGELIHDGDANADSYLEAEAEVLSLGIGSAGGIGEHEADPGFKVRDDRPAFLDKVIARAEKATGKPRIRAVDDGSVHSAEEKLGVSSVPSVVADFIQLPTDGDKLREVAVIVGVVNREKAGCFSGKADHVLPEKGWCRIGIGRGWRVEPFRDLCA